MGIQPAQGTPTRETPGVLLLDRDGRRCRERLTGLCRTGRVRACESIEDWLVRADRIEVDVLVVSADTYSEAEITASVAALDAIQPGARLVLADVPERQGGEHPLLALHAWAVYREGAPLVELAEGLELVAHGQAVLSGDRLGQVMVHLQAMVRLAPSARVDAAPQALARLTSREQEILGLLSKRKSNQEIAAALHLQLGTVKNHVHSVLRKLGLRSRQQVFHLSAREAGEARSSLVIRP
jgi:DNA-binding NarL/FixJ family response regulator